MIPTVTIVLPCYNGAGFLAQSIDSVIAQTFTDWELIIVNDCSKDNSLEIMQRYAEKDNRIRIINNEHNLKLPGALNRGFQEAKGKYLTWTSHDNRMGPTMLEEFVSYLDNNPDKPLLLVEYCHAMGNGPGDFKEYLDLTEEYPALCGGFVWEWCDHAVYNGKTPSGRDMYWYGGSARYTRCSTILGLETTR